MRLPVWAVFGAAAAGCSLIIPLDYVGGGAGSGGTGAGHGGTTGGTTPGGSSNGAEAGAGEGGNGEVGGTAAQGGSSGSSGQGGTGQGGAGQGGSQGGVGGSEMGGTSMGAMGGSSQGGEAGVPPEGGAGNAGGSSGAGGTAGGGRGGTSGGQGGTSGGGRGGSAGCSFDTTSNPQHCGTCSHACAVGDECIDSKCVSSPCDELGCGSIQMAINSNGGMRKDAVGTTADVCVEVPSYTPTTGYLPAINCWNVEDRSTTVNNVAVVCDNVDRPLNMPKRKGGYCFHAGPGNWDTTGFVMPFAAGCCKVPTGGNGGTGGS